ncbi:hypothetical protein DUI87_02831 [Hirundo rustica rustica]|uniref:ribonuclease H n=1 Tax=Hirundo rustica rustica TaxID=333673 RepID=A0A3M0LG98_HIRRU|nr:hypothetical protein DUI87_02831 [Hirundo rustica rustica]
MGPVQTSLPMSSMIPKGQPCAVLDIKDCFFSIPLHDEDKERFAFSIVFPNSQHPNLRFQWKVLPQGMVNSPTICQITVDRALEPVRRSDPTVTIVQYMDDILIAAPSASQDWIIGRPRDAYTPVPEENDEPPSNPQHPKIPHHLIYLLIVSVLRISPTLGDMGIYMTDFDSNVQDQLNSFEFSKLTRSPFSFSSLCNLSCGAPYGCFPLPVHPYDAAGTVSEKSVACFLGWQLVIWWNFFSTCHLFLLLFIHETKVFTFRPVGITSKIPGRFGFPIWVHLVMREIHLLHVASVA